jgi:hypothetical protein
MAILHELTKSGRWLRKLSFKICRVRVVIGNIPSALFDRRTEVLSGNYFVPVTYCFQ